MGHFDGLGPSSNRGALLVCIEPKPPTKCRSSWNTETGTRGENAQGSGMPKAKEERRRRNPIVFEDVHLMDKTTFGSNAEIVLWKQGGRHGLFDYGKLSQAHVFKLGESGTGLIALALSPFVRKCTATDLPALYCFCVRTSSPPSPRYCGSSRWTPSLPTLRQLTTPTALATALHAVCVVVAELRAEDVLREFSQGRFAPGWRVWSVGEDLLSACWGTWVGREAVIPTLRGGTAVKPPRACMVPFIGGSVCDTSTFLDNAANDIDRETRDRRSTNVILYWEEVAPWLSRGARTTFNDAQRCALEYVHYLFTQSSVRCMNFSVNSYANYYPIPTYPPGTNLNVDILDALFVYLDPKLLTALGSPSKSTTGSRTAAPMF
ncbi:hypothetical protein EDB85DRAFT_2271971 [Lactarius pseudohatsudake]|nr:hypothetical protein EDB85DRAFT_2271971 [Lactarius pseudohatsudake]